jgi:hypothetical protein
MAIDLASQREIFPEGMEMSYYKGFSEVVEHMKNCAHYNNEKVHYVFDMRQESTYNTALLFRMLQAIPQWNRFMGGLSFEPARDNPRLQAADLFVREVMKAWDNRVAPIKRKMRRSWKVLLDTNRFHGEVLGLDFFLSLKASIPEMEKRVGMSMPQFAQWLGERGLVDNMSNRLMYLDWLGKNDIGKQ